MSTSAYLVSRINKSYHPHHEALCSQLKKYANIDPIFIPHLFNPWDIPPKEIEAHVFEEDLSQMKKNMIGIVSFPIGKDCSSEIGWFHGNHKTVIGIIWDSNTEHSNTCIDQYNNISSDWMVKGFLTYVIVIGCKDTYNQASQDSILKNKVYYVSNFESIAQVLHGIR